MDDYERAYWAGYLDGEGCFRLVNGKYPRVEVTTTHKRTLEELSEFFGGSKVSKGHAFPGHKPIFRWQAGGKDCKDLLYAVMPYLLEKKPQAILLQLVFDKNIDRDCAAKELRRLKKVHS